MTESFNNMIKTFLKTYIESVFNTKIETVDENYELQEIQNPFIDQLIMNSSTYKTEPFGMNDEINNFINELVNNYGLNLDFVINIRYSNLSTIRDSNLSTSS